MTEVNKSELKVGEILDCKKISFQKVPTGKNKTPDFLLNLNGHRSLWEVKELVDNPNEREIVRNLNNHSSLNDWAEREPLIYEVTSSRLDNSIKKAASQLKEYVDLHSKVIVICDCRSEEVKDLLLLIEVAQKISGQPVFYSDHSDKVEVIGWINGMLTPARKKYISALAVIHEKSNEICFFHNPYTSLPLTDTPLINSFSRHYFLEENGKEKYWVDLNGNRLF